MDPQRIVACVLIVLALAVVVSMILLAVGHQSEERPR